MYYYGGYGQQCCNQGMSCYPGCGTGYGTGYSAAIILVLFILLIIILGSRSWHNN